MNSKILIVVVLSLVITGTIARQCYQCIACPKPFKGNEEGVKKTDVGDNDYCFKAIALGVENRGSAGANCNPIDKVNYCCKGNLCNGATTSALSVKLLVATASLLFAVRLFH